MNNICAGIVTFNPDLEKLDVNISSVKNQVDRIIICDNGSSNADAIARLIDKYGIIIQMIRLRNNMGIAAALNQIMQTAINLKYNWVLTLDQDSCVPENLINEYRTYMTQINVALISPDIVYRGNEQYFTAYNNEYDYVDWTITSASLTNTEAWHVVGGFNEALFIDKVDFEFCWRIRKAGFKIIRVHTINIIHELGRLKCVRLLGRIIYVTNHSPFRYYYMSRNAIIVNQITGEGSYKVEILKLILKIIFFEKNKKEKIKNIISGVNDSKNFKNLGHIVNRN